MQELKPQPSLQDFQEYVRQMKIERGFRTDDKIYECLLMGEEVGELFSAVRKNLKGGRVADDSTVGNVELEIADVFIYLLSIANQHGIDLEAAFRRKEAINNNRVWKKV